jgi:hypothetical protein
LHGFNSDGLYLRAKHISTAADLGFEFFLLLFEGSICFWRSAGVIRCGPVLKGRYLKECGYITPLWLRVQCSLT